MSIFLKNFVYLWGRYLSLFQFIYHIQMSFHLYLQILMIFLWLNSPSRQIIQLFMSSLKLKDILLYGENKSIKKLSFHGHSGNKIQKICCNNDCKFDAFCCEIKSCKICMEEHRYCYFRQMDQLSRECEQYFNHSKRLNNMLIDIQKILIKQIAQSRQENLESATVKWHNLQDSKIIQQIFFSRNCKRISGHTMNKLFIHLYQKKPKKDFEKYLARYEQKAKQLLNALKIEREVLFDQIFHTKEQMKNVVQIKLEEAVIELDKNDSKLNNKQDQLIDEAGQEQVNQDSSYKPVENENQSFHSVQAQDQSYRPEQSCPSEESENSSCLSHQDQSNEPSYQSSSQLSPENTNTDKLNSNSLKILINSPVKQRLGPFKSMKLLYGASKSDFDFKKLQKQCKDKCNTIVILQIDDNNKVFAYSQKKWKNINKKIIALSPKKSSFTILINKQNKVVLKDSIMKVFDQNQKSLPFGNDAIFFGRGNYSPEIKLLHIQKDQINGYEIYQVLK